MKEIYQLLKMIGDDRMFFKLIAIPALTAMLIALYLVIQSL